MAVAVTREGTNDPCYQQTNYEKINEIRWVPYPAKLSENNELLLETYTVSDEPPSDLSNNAIETNNSFFVGVGGSFFHFFSRISALFESKKDIEDPKPVYYAAKYTVPEPQIEGKFQLPPEDSELISFLLGREKSDVEHSKGVLQASDLSQIKFVGNLGVNYRANGHEDPECSETDGN
ncbi:hypothetical protein D5R81_05380 [Parashewanella spongiae]|uniref:Uncharacterized protein n=1 Tax=Parashewanella spongiae TaxID=342950 RepID=A0A3A6TR17_9GAMM|nr:hypothetical protein [Parashewanella spongiae]MCL1079560.1 hypothetical protein [Parashewanella spongiae]RJY18467.1 hypothetical protein D5R81_05380 [Parashewanella spongiae]